MARYGVIGSGDVGKALALGLRKHGHDVRIGSRDGKKLAAWSKEHGVGEGTFAAVAAHAEIVILAVAGGVAEQAVKGVAGELAGKVVIDATNPISGPPVNGILPFFTGPNDSLMERLQRAVPAARFVKAFSCVGNALMVDPKLPGGRPSMFIAGNGEEAGCVAARPARLGRRGRGRSGGCSRHRAALPALVRPRIPAERLGPRLPGASPVGEARYRRFAVFISTWTLPRPDWSRNSRRTVESDVVQV
jgi:predicted dinucleotide-binding enzyme